MMTRLKRRPPHQQGCSGCGDSGAEMAEVTLAKRPIIMSIRKESRKRRHPSWLLVTAGAVLILASDPATFVRAESIPIRDVPPEIDVSPNPTPTYRRPTTRRPTRRPSTARPTMISSNSTASPVGIVGASPTLLPRESVQPTKPTSAPQETSTPTLPIRTENPTVRSTDLDLPVAVPQSTAPTTIQPTLAPTPEPTKRPTSKPTPSPTPVPTKRPTLKPTLRPKESMSPIAYTQRPSTATSFAPYVTSVPFSFSTTLESNEDPQDVAAECERIWEVYFTARMQAAYQTADDIQSGPVDLNVTVPGVRVRRNTRKTTYLRRLQEQEKLVLESDGAALFRVDGSVDEKTLSQSVDSTLSQIITQGSLQQALILGNSDAEVTSVSSSLSTSSTSDTNGDPSTLQKTIGFILLGLAILSVLFWSRMLYKKRAKAQKIKRLAALRESQTKVARLPAPYYASNKGASASHASGMASVRLSGFPVIETLKTAKEGSSSDASSEYHGIDSLSEGEDSDSFAKELQEAVSLDQMAWSHAQTQPTRPVSRGLVFPWSAGHQNHVPGRTHEQDFELNNDGIQRISSFPYGDENGSPGRERTHDDLELTLNDSVNWTASGVTLKVVSRVNKDQVTAEEQFEPYGDSSLQQVTDSWNATAYARKMDRPSQYSFAYPLKRRELSDSTRNTEPGGRDDDREDVGGVDDEASSNYHKRIVNDMINQLSSDSDSEVDPETLIQEVARLRDYVTRYSQRKSIEKSVRSDPESTTRNASVPNPLLERLPPRNSPRRHNNAEQAAELPPQGNSGWSVELDAPGNNRGVELGTRSVDTLDEEDTGRLGIGRCSVQKPSQLLSFWSSRRPAVKEVVEQPPSVTPDESEGTEGSDVNPDAEQASLAAGRNRRRPDLADDGSEQPSSKGITREFQAHSYSQTRQTVGQSVNKEESAKVQNETRSSNLTIGIGLAPLTETNPRRAQPTSSTRWKPPSQISTNNSKFSNIISMFESKPKNAIQPVSENWQYNGSTPKAS